MTTSKLTTLRLALLTLAFVCAFALSGVITNKNGGHGGGFGFAPRSAAAQGVIGQKNPPRP